MNIDPHFLLILAFATIATYLTRAGGYVLIRRMKTISPRVEAALNAVPAAVITALVAPAAITGGIETIIALVVAFVAGFKIGGMRLLVLCWAVAMAIRYGLA